MGRKVKIIVCVFLVLIGICVLFLFMNKNEGFIKIDNGIMKEKEIIPGLVLISKTEKPNKESNKLVLTVILKNNTNQIITFSDISNCERPEINIDNISKYYTVIQKKIQCPFNIMEFSIIPYGEIKEEIVLIPKYPFKHEINKKFKTTAVFLDNKIKNTFTLDSLN